MISFCCFFIFKPIQHHPIPYHLSSPIPHPIVNPLVPNNLPLLVLNRDLRTSLLIVIEPVSLRQIDVLEQSAALNSLGFPVTLRLEVGEFASTALKFKDTLSLGGLLLDVGGGGAFDS